MTFLNQPSIREKLIVITMITSIFSLVISGPIHNLGKVAKQISENHDFTIRAKKESNDETELLVDTFNEMINTINKQNKGLVQARDSYLALYDKNPMMLFTLDHDGVIKSANQFVVTHLGINTSELIGNNINILILEDDIKTTEELITRCCMNPDSIQHCDLRVADINEKTIWIHQNYVQ